MTRNERIAQDAAYQTVLTDTITELYKTQDRYENGFGFGFHRWIPTIYLKQILKWEFRVIVRECDKLVKRGLIDRKWSPASYVSYSLKEYPGHKIAHDYFIISERSCRVCGCTDNDCRKCIKKTGIACHWIEEDLCSACKPNK